MFRNGGLSQRQLPHNLAANTGFLAGKQAEYSYARWMGDGFGEQSQFIISGCALNGPQVQLHLRFRCGAVGLFEIRLLVHRISSIYDIKLPHTLRHAESVRASRSDEVLQFLRRRHAAQDRDLTVGLRRTPRVAIPR